MPIRIENKMLRSFGLVVGGIFALIALTPVFRGESPRFGSLVVTGALLLPAVAYPKTLYWPYRSWMFLGALLGWINTRIILSFVFYLLMTPMGLIWGLFSEDPLALKRIPSNPTDRAIKKRRQNRHFERMF